MIYFWHNQLAPFGLPKPQAGNIYLKLVQRDNKTLPYIITTNVLEYKDTVQCANRKNFAIAPKVNNRHWNEQTEQTSCAFVNSKVLFLLTFLWKIRQDIFLLLWSKLWHIYYNQGYLQTWTKIRTTGKNSIFVPKTKQFSCNFHWCTEARV